MESHQNLATNEVGFCLLPSELIQHIFLHLALPDIIRIKSVNKSILSIISDQEFVRNYNLESASAFATWLFIYKKRWHRDAILHGFADCSNRWFKIMIGELLKKVVPPGEDVYFLAASGNFFLFALNNSQQLVSINHVTRAVKKIPPSPLGPRGTSSWRRSGMKLLSYPPGADDFRFLFAELNENRPILYEYDSQTNNWVFKEAKENDFETPDGCTFLSACNARSGSVVIATGGPYETPIVLRPRLAGALNEEGRLAIGFSRENYIDQLHIYGDGNMMIVRSNHVYDANVKVRVLTGVELWGMSTNGRHWDLITRVPNELIEQIKKPYGAIMGCLEQRDGIIRAILMSNLEGIWDIIWLCYDILKKDWNRIEVPECKMKGSIMAGISLSSALTLSN
ncbi:hypothetical protein Fot_04867 [Forsythia ovata]|uniref:F-box domain-containing protein n=1 Tax=Forsythia ovata TaxID=205694 RepID=A0ABD1WNI3_9LAMI